MRALRIEIPEVDLDDEVESALREVDRLAPEPAHVVGDGDGALEGLVDVAGGLGRFIPRGPGFVRPDVIRISHGARDLALGVAMGGVLATLLQRAGLGLVAALAPVLLALVLAPIVSHLREVSRSAPRYPQAPESVPGILLLPDALVFRHEGAISIIPRAQVVDFFTSVERRGRGLAFSLTPTYYYQVPEGITVHLAYVEYREGVERHRFHYDALSYRRAADAQYDFHESVTDLALLEAQQAELQAWLREGPVA